MELDTCEYLHTILSTRYNFAPFTLHELKHVHSRVLMEIYVFEYLRVSVLVKHFRAVREINLLIQMQLYPNGHEHENTDDNSFGPV